MKNPIAATRSHKREHGSIGATELLLIGTILAIGLAVGLQALRIAVITELADLADAIGAHSQSYSMSGAAGHHGSSNGSAFQDQLDTCDTADITMTNPRCLQLPPGTPEPPGPPSP